MIASLTCALLVAAAAPSFAGEVVARAAGEPITVGETLARAQEAGIPPLAALESLVQEATVLRAARAAGVGDRPELKARLAVERDDLELQVLLEKVVFPTIPVTDEELRRAFHGEADRVRLSLVVRDSLEEATASLDRLRQGASLIEEAKASPEPIVRDSAGVLGWVERRELAPELASAAFSAQLLVPTGPIAVRKGYAVILVHERVLGDERQLPRQASELARVVRLGKREEATRRLVGSLRRQGKARVEPAVLARFRDASSSPAPQAVVARAGALKVTAAELKAAAGVAGMAPALADRHRKTDAYQELAWQLLDRKLLYAEAERRGIDRDPEVARALAPLERRALTEAYLRDVAAGAPPVRDEDVEARYAERPSEYTSPPRRACLHLVSRDEGAIDRARDRLERGGTFEEVAQALTRQGEGHAGSVELSLAELDAMAAPEAEPALAAAIAATRASQWTAPVRTKAGWTVYRCGTPLLPQRRPLAEVKGRIVAQLREERAQVAVATRLRELRREARVVVDEAVLAKVLDAGPR